MLETEIKINGIDYRIDLIVLEELKDGKQTDFYSVIHGEKIEQMLSDLIKTKSLGEHSQAISQLVSEFTETIQANNQKLREINQALDAQYLESATGD